MRVKKRTKIKRIVIIVLFSVAFTVFGYFSVRQLNRAVLPTVISIASLTVQNKVSEAIINSVNETMAYRNLTTQDFYKRSGDNILVNTVLVNEICAEIAVKLSNQLMNMELQEITVPMGAALGIEFFANMGPEYSISVLPMGTAIVDYETSFELIGINQVKFELWLNVESNVQIVNPLQSSSFTVRRRVAIVNTVL